MSISYSGIIGNKGKGTLPSVEDWGVYGNQSILKDPPKSITTRRIDKVNQDGSLNEMLYHSGDRFAENLNVYARGVNPMVSVEYGNIGSFNGTSNGNGNGAFGNGAPGKLPYRILTDGAFRPPILRMEQLMPLSRQPRLATACMTTPQFIDYSKKVLCDPSTVDTLPRQIHSNALHANTVPTRVVKFQEPIREHFEVNYVIENPIRPSAIVNMSAKANLQQENQEPLRQASKEVNKYSFAVNANGAAYQNYIHDDLQLTRNLPLHETQAAKTLNIQSTIQADNELELRNNLPAYQAITNKSANQYTRIDSNGEIILERNMPEHDAFTNLNDTRKYKRMHADNEYAFNSKTVANDVIAVKTSQTAKSENNRQELNLPSSLNLGGFKAKANQPYLDRNSNLINPNYTTRKQTISETARMSQNERSADRSFRPGGSMERRF
jgi:hypothetical protein